MILRFLLWRFVTHMVYQFKMTDAMFSQEDTRPTSVPADPWSETRPIPTLEDDFDARWDETHPTPIYAAHHIPEERIEWAEPTRKHRGRGCGCLLGMAVPPLLLLLVYLFFPGRTNILLLGTDAREPETWVGRTDTMVLTTILPWQPYAGMLSMPRDLWVVIPDYGENRINAAHFFGEADHPGGGPPLAIQTVQSTFGVDVDYYLRVRFLGFLEIVDALNGVDIELSQLMSGYEAGTHHLNGEQALAFVRDRAGSDDFARITRGQIFLKAISRRLLTPSAWVRLPQVVTALGDFIETDIPVWLWPRLGFALLRLGPNGVDGRVITREMTNPFTTSGGAQVLGPNWQLINPVLMEVFGQ